MLPTFLSLRVPKITQKSNFCVSQEGNLAQNFVTNDQIGNATIVHAYQA